MVRRYFLLVWPYSLFDDFFFQFMYFSSDVLCILKMELLFGFLFPATPGV